MGLGVPITMQFYVLSRLHAGTITNNVFNTYNFFNTEYIDILRQIWTILLASLGEHMSVYKENNTHACHLLELADWKQADNFFFSFRLFLGASIP